ncbi:MAG: hypothetical protein AAGK00_08765 [Pseudomonadota bacterium]
MADPEGPAGDRSAREEDRADVAPAAIWRLSSATCLLLCGLLFFGPSILFGIPAGFDLEIHLNWTTAFREALSWRTPYPRWLPSLWHETGAADYYFYAPLSSYMTSLAGTICPGCDAGQAMVGAAFAFRLLATIGTAALCRALGMPKIAVAAGCLMMLAPYQGVNWNVRMAFGEMMGSALVPWFLFGLLRCVRDGKWHPFALATAALSATHLPTLLISVLIGAVLCLTVWRPRLAIFPGAFLTALGAGAIGLGLTAVYWLPAISLLDTVNSAHLTVYAWNDRLLDFASGGWALGYLGQSQPLLTLSSLALLVCSTDKARAVRPVVLTLLALVWFFVSPFSSWVWASLPLLGIVQFPSRFLVFYELAIALALPLLWQVFRNAQGQTLVRGAVLAAGLVAVITVTAPPITRWIAPPETEPRAWMTDMRRGALEWLGHEMPPADPETFVQAIYTFQKPPAIQVEGGEADLRDVEPTRLVVSANCPDGCRITLARGYWRHWEIVETEGGRAELKPNGALPLLSLEVSPEGGRYVVELVRPAVVTFGLGISILSLLAFGASVMRLRRRQRL